MELSRLFNLDLLGVGTEDVECLTSYCTRLAESHAVTLHSLVTREIFPQLNKSYLFSDGKYIHDSVGRSWWKTTSSSLNGLNSLTGEWVTVLNTLTGRQDLQYLTLLAYSDVLPYRGLLRREIAWCPMCYEDWRINGKVIYMPLRWMLEAVTICPHHKCLLETHCPFSDCQKSFSALSSNAAVGFCPFCNRWLGSTERKWLVDHITLKNQLSINVNIGELIAASSKYSLTPKKANIGLLVKRFIEESLGGNAKALADILNMHHKSIYEIRDGTQLPQISTLLKISNVVGITPLQILTEDISSVTLKRLRPSNVKKCRLLKQKHQKFDKAATRATLETIIANEEMPPPSMAKVALRLGYDHSFLSTHLPEQCSVISERYRQYQIARKKARLDRYCERIRQVTTDIHAQGKYPSYKQVSKIVPALFKEPLVREAYHKMMAELGYKRQDVY